MPQVEENAEVQISNHLLEEDKNLSLLEEEKVTEDQILQDAKLDLTGLHLQEDPSIEEESNESIDLIETSVRPRNDNLRSFERKLGRKIHSQIHIALSFDGIRRTAVLHDLWRSLTHLAEASVIAFIGQSHSEEDIYYYDIASDYFARHPKRTENLLRECVKIYSHKEFPALFCLCFFQWLLSNYTRDCIRYVDVFLKGSNRIFWLDLERGEKRFAHMFDYILSQGLLNQRHYRTTLSQDMDDIFTVISKFMFYYRGKDYLPIFLDRLIDNIYHTDSSEEKILEEVEDYRSSQLLSSRKKDQSLFILDMFVQVVVRTCLNIRSETVLIQYLSSFEVLKGMRMLERTSAVLFKALQSYTLPGGPIYPTRNVRAVARKSMNQIFPHGSWARTFVTLYFRFMHPVYSFQSLFYYIGCIILWIFSLISRPFRRKPSADKIKEKTT